MTLYEVKSVFFKVLVETKHIGYCVRLHGEKTRAIDKTQLAAISGDRYFDCGPVIRFRYPVHVEYRDNSLLKGAQRPHAKTVLNQRGRFDQYIIVSQQLIG